MRYRFLFLFAGFVSSFSGYSQDKCTNVLEVLDKVKDACEKFPAQNYCNIFVGRVVKEVYGIDDFVNGSSTTGYFSANEITTKLFVELSDKWEQIGSCDDQDVLKKAQDMANSNRCIIAAWKNPAGGSGHVAMILPGQLQKGWFDAATLPGGMMVPNAASFAKDAPQLNFVCQKLSGAFSFAKRSGVFLFARKDQ